MITYKYNIGNTVFFFLNNPIVKKGVVNEIGIHITDNNISITYSVLNSSGETILNEKFLYPTFEEADSELRILKEKHTDI